MKVNEIWYRLTSCSTIKGYLTVMLVLYVPLICCENRDSTLLSHTKPKLTTYTLSSSKA